MNTRGKSKVAVPTSKKRKGLGATSSSASVEVRHPFLRFSVNPPEDLFQLLCMRPLGLGQCTDWATLERESTRVVSTTDAYYLWSMATGHIFDLAYFIALAFRYQTYRHKKGPIYLGVYVTHFARHFSLLNTPEQSSTLTLVGQMSPQDISSMIHMRMIERRHPPQPLPSSHRHAPFAASSLGVFSEKFASFRQYCGQRFDSIDATLQQICQYLHIAPPVPLARDPDQSDDEDH
ncbi:hypothetical protein PVK06_028203 [Gossypium arboreum]|uniref:Uncharacterized protein n=1 Tax=Gossypium arboreum TaxID=29729 RepID=A0ABR0P2B2_GOSAR|nr:hypothetical protein PVK06_028203 [Gossypium arboreum]